MSASTSSDAPSITFNPPNEVVAPCREHISAANAALDRLEQNLEGADTNAIALDAVNEAAGELRAAFAFVDQLEESVAAAGLLVEATERRLEVFERGETLPESLAQLPPAMFTTHQFTRQVRRREKAAQPDLPELALLPPSRAEERAKASASSTSAPSSNGAHPTPAAAAAAGLNAELRESAEELQRIAAEKAEELQRLAKSGLATAKEKAPQLVAAAERAKETARSFWKSSGVSKEWSSFWNSATGSKGGGGSG